MTDLAIALEVNLGGHHFHVEDHGGVYVHFYRYGPSYDDLETLQAFVDDVYSQHQQMAARPVGILVDQGQEGRQRPGPKARKILSGVNSLDGVFALGLYGGTMTLRSLSTLMIKAARLMGKLPSDVPVSFFKTEDEARVFLHHHSQHAALAS